MRCECSGGGSAGPCLIIARAMGAVKCRSTERSRPLVHNVTHWLLSAPIGAAQQEGDRS